MKHLKISAILIFSIFILYSGAAYAQPPESEVNIIFEEGTEIVAPVDPDDPSKPMEPMEPGTGESGSLTMNYVSPITFGTQTISSVTKDYNSTTMKPFIQVTDLRGSGIGWRVEASCSNFSNGVSDTLPGAVIHLDNGAAISANPALVKPVPESTITMPANNTTSVRVVTANADQGLGTWVNRWYPVNGPNNDSVRLTILAGTASAEAHTAIITWRLTDAP